MKFKMIALSLVTMAMAVTAFADPAAYQAKVSAALQVCNQKLSTNYTAPIQWKSLDASAKADLASCMQAEGVVPHHRHHHRFFKAVKACVAQAGVTLPAFQPGVKPQLTAAQKAAIKTCAQQVKAQFKANQAAASSN